MKKSTLNIIILTLTFINLVLNVLIIFSVIPTANKTNNMITKVAGIIDLELKEEGADELVSIDQIDSRTITNPDGKNTITVSIPSEDGKNHYAVATVIVSLNKSHEDYAKLSESFTNAMGLISSEVDDVISAYTYETAAQSKDEMQAQLLQELRKMFQSDMIYDVSITLLIQ